MDGQSSVPNVAVTNKEAPTTPVPVTLAHGDGIGPEIMEASLRVLLAAGASIAFEPIEIGEQIFKKGYTSGMTPDAWESLRRTGIFYKAPITTPQGGGYKSLNVTIRKSLGLFSNVRPCASLTPFVDSKHPGTDVVIVRENEEDLYAGIEHRQTSDVYQCLKLVSRPGCERIIRFAFEYARNQGRKKVSCFSKDNIMKLTDGLFHSVFDEVREEYPDIETDHWIIDIGTAKVAADPTRFDVIVTSNLYGDIISDVAAELTGSVGLGPSINVGSTSAMFEAVHGSAPDIAGRDIANPSGLLLAGVMMLKHIGQSDVAEHVHNAWLRTIEDGIHTADIYREDRSQSLVGTRAFSEAVVARLGQKPRVLSAVDYASAPAMVIPEVTLKRTETKELMGIDVFADWRGSADDLAEKLQAAENDALPLKMITNRGVKVWPDGLPETFCTDHWRCRFLAQTPIEASSIIKLLTDLQTGGVEFVKTEHLYHFDGKPGFSLGQGQ
ncbi:MAG: NADP-dependent isocitrate dehydrogenase [Pseudomonadota bacterium]